MVKTLLSVSIFLLVMAPALSGCRFGNHIEQAKQKLTITYYETAPQLLEFCADVQDAAGTHCVPAATNLIPSDVALTFTNPVALLQDNETLDAAFAGLQQSGYQLPTNIDANGGVSYLGFTPASVLWDTNACSTRLSVEETGKTVASSGPFTSGSKLTLSGRLQLTVSVIRTFDGDCAKSLKKMYECYLGINQCGGSSDSSNQQLQNFVKEVFDDWIRAGAMTAADIMTAGKVAYKVSYQ